MRFHMREMDADIRLDLIRDTNYATLQLQVAQINSALPVHAYTSPALPSQNIQTS